ncbi:MULTISPECIES: acyltransferase family protein [unclassified Sphingomonas]|jgi:surface polysaccharide O-acyltransferase-like enzyme|uniref:acyltransferase family protein n=1 Tax=unclassified Sphingomonas TaxID=196159 RepID=UPI000A87AFB5|nr:MULTISPECIES: acyltransferase family protein [unclassified Sphingomonas]
MTNTATAPRPDAAPPIARHYGMDWLRIAAFALLILYHIGLVYAPWNFHVKSPHVADWVVVPMLALNAWRLALLFVVSGYATRALLRRAGGVTAFARNRTVRLVVPLLFGVIVVVPPQPWIELVTKHGYGFGLPHFWIHDYFRFGTLDGLVLPTWNHLWFVGYLWVYTMALAVLIALVRTPWLQRVFDRAFGGVGMLVLPLAWLLAVHLRWFPMRGETHALFDDPVAHAIYLPAFLFGFGLARSAAAMAAIRRWWKVAGLAAIAGYGVKAAAELNWPGAIPIARDFLPVYLSAHSVQQWGAIVALIGLADRFLDRDHPRRTMLTEAVFPFYLIHQTIIVAVVWALRRFAPSAPIEFTITLAATVAGCWAFYLAGRRIGWLRPLIGLRPRLEPRAMPARVANQS